MVRFRNRRGTAGQHLREGNHALRRTRLPCRRFHHNGVRLHLHALACNLATFPRCIDLPGAMANRSLTGLQPRLIRTGARALRHARVVRHGRTITFRLAGVAVTGQMARAIPAAIRRLRSPPTYA